MWDKFSRMLARHGNISARRGLTTHTGHATRTMLSSEVLVNPRRMYCLEVLGRRGMTSITRSINRSVGGDTLGGPEGACTFTKGAWSGPWGGSQGAHTGSRQHGARAQTSSSEHTEHARTPDDPRGGGGHANFGENTAKSSTYVAMLASPFLFTDYTPKEPLCEAFTLSGRAWDYIARRVLEQEMGQSALLALLVIAYLCLLGHEGKINGQVTRLKWLYGANARTVGHPNQEILKKYR